MEIINFKYSVPYLLYLSFLFLLLFVEFRQKNHNNHIGWIRILVIFSFTLFLGGKGFTGRDVFLYYDLYQRLPTIWHLEGAVMKFSSSFELGFQVYMVLIKSIWSSFYFFSFVNVFIDVLLLDLIIRRYSKYYVLSFFIYLVFYGFTFELDQIRNIKAILIFLFSLRFIERKQFGWYIVANLIGCLFHVSAFLFLFFYWFLQRKISLRLALSILIVGCFLFILHINYIKPIIKFIAMSFGPGFIHQKIMGYLSSDIWSKNIGMSIGFCERVVTYLMICVFFRKKIVEDSRMEIFVNMYVLYFIFYIYFYEIQVFSIRCSALFVFSYVILYPQIFFIAKNKIIKLIFLSILIFYSFMRIVGNYHFIEYVYQNSLFVKQDEGKRRYVTKISFQILNKNEK